MELKLVVLAGSKQGTQIPLKKEEFVIGRSKECTLRVGSEAISRRHCRLARSGASWTACDLGSRNGTYVNEVRIESETPLAVGDELRVGPLRFRVEPAVAPAAPVHTTDISRGKQPPVKDVAEAAQRSVGKADELTTEDDISRWLLDVVDPKTDESLKETRTIRMEETTRLSRPAPPAPADADAEDSADVEESSQASADAEKADDKSSSWNWLKLGKGAAKKKPGKLPPRSSEASSKDSREAAADILREMTRRR
jgi:pSer/pThr/pTyr-binding forkhead associated (FHA) protein